MKTPLWTAKVLTLFPRMFPGPLAYSLAGKGLEKGIWDLKTLDIRTFAIGSHAQVDDTPFGGGAGMVLRADVLGKALKAARSKTRPIYLTPRGQHLDQERVRDLMSASEITLLCGRFEGIDQRIIESTGALELSIGDYILTNGDIAAINIIDSCVRLLDGVLSSKASKENESYEDGLLEYPQYTLPREYGGLKI